jgi:hypothetical protein
MNNIEIDQEIKEYLDAYKVDFPNEEEIEVSIEYIMSNVQPIESKKALFQKKAKSLLVNGTRELLNFGWQFWVLNGMFMLLGAISLIQFKTDPYLTSFVLAPLPFIVGLMEILKSKDEGLVELELTLKYNAQQIFLSRLLVVGGFNLVINLVLSILCLTINPEIIYTKLLGAWTLPYVVVTGLAFIFAMKTKGNIASGITIAVWFAFCFGLMQTPDMKEFLLKMNVLEVTLLLLIGMVIWASQIVKIKRMGEQYETQNG